MIDIYKAKLMLLAACRNLDNLGSKGVLKVFVGQALETGNGNGFY